MLIIGSLVVFFVVPVEKDILHSDGTDNQIREIKSIEAWSRIAIAAHEQLEKATI